MPDGVESSHAVAAYARVRTAADGNCGDVQVDGGFVKVRSRSDTLVEFSIDHAFDENATQEQVYDMVGAGLVSNVLEGYNATCIAYGQTGSGKTYTMLGPEGIKLEGGEHDSMLGIVPRACFQLFSNLASGLSVQLSYIEVYNDGVNDLFGEKHKYLPLRELTPGHVEPDGLTRLPVQNTAAVLKAIAHGGARRVVAPMAMNPRSSRGHGIIQLEVFTESGHPHGRLTLVDLAGMESSKKSAPVEGASNVKERREEAKRINMSLLALSSVVSALATNAVRIPFRDSKLTRLLQSSLGGNCKAAIIVTLRGEKKNLEESMGTLRFAQRAKAVQAKVYKVGEQDDAGAAALALANKELAHDL